MPHTCKWIPVIFAALLSVAIAVMATRATGGPPEVALPEAVPTQDRDAWNLPQGVRLELSGDAAERYVEPGAMLMLPDDNRLLVALRASQEIAVVDCRTRQITERWPVPGEPSALCHLPGGTTVAVACAAPQSRVLELHLSDGHIVRSVRTGHTSSALAVMPDYNWLLVCNRFDNDVSVIDLETFVEAARLPVDREPIAICAVPEKNLFAVANHLPSDPADRFAITAVVTLFELDASRAGDISDLQTGQPRALPDWIGRHDIRLPDGSSGTQGMCISPDGQLLLVTHILSNYQLVPAQVTGGWTNSNAVTVIDLAGRELFTTVHLDDLSRGAANPYDVAWTDDGRWILVAHQGTHELSLIDARGLLERFAEHNPLPYVAGTPHNPGLLPGLRRRVALPGRGAWHLSTAGNRVYVSERFSDSLSELALPQNLEEEPAAPRVVRLGPEPVWTLRRWGEYLFHDATTCFQNWQSCASCHPDARSDSLNWDLTNDGVGNPKNTKSMLWSHRTPPAMATGVRATAEVAVRAGFQHILFTERPKAEYHAVDAYLRQLEPVPSPYLVDGRLSERAKLGKRLFHNERTGCAVCHPAPLFTDLQMHNVGSRDYQDHRDVFDTPTLVEVWRTAPYLHTGHDTTLRALLVEGEHGAGLGGTKGLSEEEIDALVEYILSL